MRKRAADDEEVLISERSSYLTEVLKRNEYTSCVGLAECTDWAPASGSALAGRAQRTAGASRLGGLRGAAQTVSERA